MKVKERIKSFIIKLALPFEYRLLRLFSKCKICCDGIYYPNYGVAPHVHDLSITGSFIGSTKIIDKKEWPENYDDCDNGCGVYYCEDSKCYNSKENSLKRRKEWEERNLKYVKK